MGGGFPSFVSLGRHGLEVRVRVTPRARADRIDGIVGDADGRGRLRVAVTEAADRGRANEAVIAALARAWEVPKSSLAIIAGSTDRRKTLVVAGDADALQQRLADWCRDRGFA